MRLNSPIIYGQYVEYFLSHLAVVNPRLRLQRARRALRRRVVYGAPGRDGVPEVHPPGAERAELVPVGGGKLNEADGVGLDVEGWKWSLTLVT